MLHELDCFCRQERRRVLVLCVLDLRAVGGFFPGVWGVLGGRFGAGCWNFNRAVWRYLGMGMSQVCAA